METSAIFKGKIADMRERGQTIDYELAERNTRAAIREQSCGEEQASRLVESFKTVCDKQNAEDPFPVGWPIIEDACPYAGLGTKCDPVCAYCDMKHVCMYCPVKPRPAESGVDPPCPLRIPGCRCSTGLGPSILEYYCNAGNRFMGACVQGAGDEDFLEQEIADERFSKEETEEEDVTDGETEDDDLLEKSGNKTLFKEIGGEEPLDDEIEGEEFFEDESRRLYSPQSLWPLSARFWEGLATGWEQALPPPSQPQVDYNDYTNLFSEPQTIDPQSSVAAGQHARGGRIQSSINISQLPVAYNLYSPFLVVSPELHNRIPTTASQSESAEEIPSSRTYAQSPVTYSGYSSFLPEPSHLNKRSFAAASQCTSVGDVSASTMYAQYPTAYNGYSPYLPVFPGAMSQDSEAANQNALAGKARPFRMPATEESRSRASHVQEAIHRHAATGEARSSQGPASKKDSRGWEDHEKARVKTLMKEVISEGIHARTEERWKVISSRLNSRYSINRTWTAVKNYWNRYGRSDSNIDERKVKRPDRMITGVQDPESRRKARKLKRKEAKSDDNGSDSDDDDDNAAPSSKRQKQQRSRAL